MPLTIVQTYVYVCIYRLTTLPVCGQDNQTYPKHFLE